MIGTLKPCPFCGGEAEFYRTPILTKKQWVDSVTVKCPTCEARTARVLYDAKKHGDCGEYAEAAEAWNTRYTPPKYESVMAFASAPVLRDEREDAAYRRGRFNERLCRRILEGAAQ